VLPVAYRFDRTGALASLEVDGDPLPDPRLWRCTPVPGAAATPTWLVDLETGGVRRRFEVHQVGDTSYVDSVLGHTELHEVPRFPEAAGARTVPGGLWTADPATPGVGVASPTGGPGTGGSGWGVPGAGDGVMVSPLPGVVRRVAVGVGDRVEAGAVLVVVEAMKTEHRVAAVRAGRVGRVLVAEGQEVAAGAVVVELEEAADG
jgi:biotin carboxyl carrier protein